MKEKQSSRQAVVKQAQQNRCERCGEVFRSPEELELHRSERHDAPCAVS